jgi:hypothetical protein
MPLSSLTKPFVAEFAWTAIHPVARWSWDIVSTLSNDQPYISFHPPPLPDSQWTARWVSEGNTALVSEIIHITGKSHPCNILHYSHPSLRRAISLRPEDMVRKNSSQNDETQRTTVIREYMIYERSAGSRINVHQSAIPVSSKIAGFDRTVQVTKVIENTTPLAGRNSRDTLGNKTASRRGKPDRDTVMRLRVRVPASVSDDNIDASLPPIEFRLLEKADPCFIGELGPLIQVMREIRDQFPNVAIAVSMCVLKEGRAFSRGDGHRRPCLIAVIRPPDHPPWFLSTSITPEVINCRPYS